MSVAPSGEQFEIVAGPHRATLVEVGGGIRSYTVGGRPVLDGYPAEEMCTGARGTPLIPWPNRLADGTYTYAGTGYTLHDDRGQPIGHEPVAGSPCDFRTPRPIGDTRIDYAFTGLARDGDGLAWVGLHAPDGRRVGLWADEHYRFIELYTGDTQPPQRRRRGLGVEPMTCAPNGFRSGDGVLELDPGQAITIRWGIRPD